MRNYDLELLCPICFGLHNISVDFSNIMEYRTKGSNSNSIPTLFPYLNETEREQLKSHCCPKCQKIFQKMT